MIRVGVLFPLSGPSAQWGRECANGAMAALDGVAEAVVADAADGGAAMRLVRGGAVAVLGTLFTALAMEASRAATGAGAAYIEVAAVADELGARGLPRFLRTCPRAAAFGARAVDFAMEVAGPTRWVVAYESSAFGRSLGTAVVARAKERGLAVADELTVAPDARETGIAAALARGGADGVLAASYTELSQRLWRELRVDPPRALVGVGGGWLHLGEGSDVSPVGVYAVDVAPASAIAGEGLAPDARKERAAYLDRYRSRFGAAPSVYSDLGYVGASLVGGAITACGGDPDRLVELAKRMDVPDGGTILGYGARFDGRGENLRAAPVVMQHRAGSLPVVYPPSLATAAPDTTPLGG